MNYSLMISVVVLALICGLLLYRTYSTKKENQRLRLLWLNGWSIREDFDQFPGETTPEVFIEFQRTTSDDWMSLERAIYEQSKIDSGDYHEIWAKH